MLGLLDSGAERTVVGPRGWSVLKCLGLRFERQSPSLRVGNNAVCESEGTVLVPMELKGKVCLINVIIMPSCSKTLILGEDFWRKMGVVPDLRKGVWHFSESEPKELMTVEGIREKDNLLPDQRASLDEMVNRKLESMDTARMGFTNLVEHEILTDSPPIKQRYYPVNPKKQKILEEQLETMLEQDIVEPSRSAWSSPVVLVPKKNQDEYRLVIDYRKLNSVTKKDAYPLPYVSSILDRLRDARYLSSIDIKSAYWHIPMKESSRELTAFTIPGRGLYQFKRMPFGLTNAPATFQRLIDRVLGADLEPHVFVYLDDIIILSADFETHLVILEKVLERLRQAGFVLSMDKCHFCRPQLKYLGYIIDKKGLHVDPEKVKAILGISTPTNASEVRTFLGMAAWYRKFVPNFAIIAAPLTSLTKKKVQWKWSDECTKAFEEIKSCLVASPVLTCPDFEKPFTLQTDASAYGLGAVLVQSSGEEEQVICYLSRSLTPTFGQWRNCEITWKWFRSQW